MKHYNIPIFIPHLGCPFDCIYCNQKTIAAQQYIPDARQVINTIEQYLQTIPAQGFVEVAFFGGNFTAVDKQQQVDFLQAVQPFLQEGRVQSIRVSTRPDCIDDSALDLLAHYGVRMIELGVQSLSDKVLQASAREYCAEDVYKSSHLIKKWQFDLGIQLMIGLPQDSHTQDLETTRQVIALRPQVVRIYPTLVIAETALEDIWNRGEYSPLSLKDAVLICRDMFMLFQRADIRVIRMGLYPGEELCREGIVKAGPFHPGFGELVEQAVFKEQIRQAIKEYFDKSGYAARINLRVNFRDVSKAVGRYRDNIHELTREFGLAALDVKADPSLDRNSVGISVLGDQCLVISRSRFLEGAVV